MAKKTELVKKNEVVVPGQGVDFYKALVAKMDSEFITLAEDGVSSARFTSYIDTGSYALNALISGSLYGGWPDNKVLTLAGESSTGKTYFALALSKSFTDLGPSNGVLYYDSESAVDAQLLGQRGLPLNRVIILEPESVEEFQNRALQSIELYLNCPEAKRPKTMFVLDSLGELSTLKELADADKASNANKVETQSADMGNRTKLIKRVFRVVRAKLAKAHIPLIITNHVYDNLTGYGPAKKMSGGSGVFYSSDTILMLSKSKHKDGDDITGSVVTCKTMKSRMSKQDKEVDVLIHFDRGLDRYYGLCDLAIRYGIFKRLSKQIELPDGRKVFESVINKNGAKFFTKEILDLIEVEALKEFRYGGNSGLDLIEQQFGPLDEENEEVDT